MKKITRKVEKKIKMMNIEILLLLLILDDAMVKKKAEYLIKSLCNRK